MKQIPQLLHVLAQYCDDPAQVTVQPLGAGRINDTYLVDGPSDRFVLQRINGRVFPRPVDVARNFVTVTSHLYRKQRPGPELIRCPLSRVTLAGAPCWRDRNGAVWRAQTYIEHMSLTPPLRRASQARQLGAVLASFHKLTADLDPAKLFDPLPGFHDTVQYLRQFDQVWAGYVGPDSSEMRYCRAEIDRFRPLATVLVEAERAGRIRRVTIHGDPKVDNFICDPNQQVIGLLDLDTVGPGSVLLDLGDCLRSCCNQGGEDPAGPQAAAFAVDICEAVLTGYLTTSSMITRQERELVYDAVLLIAFELALRFVTDHLQGDAYFKVHYRGENLQRALSQLHLADSITGQEQQIRLLAASL